MTANQESLSEALVSTVFIGAQLHSAYMAGLFSPGDLANTFGLQFLRKSGLTLCGPMSPGKQRYSYHQDVLGD